jgi:hypothetical protein
MSVVLPQQRNYSGAQLNEQKRVLAHDVMERIAVEVAKEVIRSDSLSALAAVLDATGVDFTDSDEEV